MEVSSLYLILNPCPTPPPGRRGEFPLEGDMALMRTLKRKLIESAPETDQEKSSKGLL